MLSMQGKESSISCNCKMPSFFPSHQLGQDNSKSGFSLVEVVIALGVVAFALISVLGLIPVGLQSFRQAIDNSATTQIVQRVVNEAQQTDFNSLANTVYYFDDQGTLLSGSTSQTLYSVNVIVSKPTSIPSDGIVNSGSMSVASTNLATLAIQITQNGGGATRNASALVARISNN